ncbi:MULTISPECIES: IclR family transcriptional regulator domain-containing protein [Nocardiopsis]|uniref:Glycerol operon regulatory protein n=1 Tax=Nocardiopsis dassonvillei (strain ATCC 23218 / DSM 43111 / CIP 107115 / JCM 7437 / KCTC 9190 / NBRC 14626 / NCTC 10488 / NRRL B-5397 / IMRU 509) TaxID=446468 RepID=D7AVM0_NOCDD|nr:MULTISPECIES: IclR family transcriptional regulator C-terminal domain-containing protein [Nocardiopsis]ADH67709.1 transcriptional regulator, IclR family [Nocardiopsis dassonvillei subsp. dassonvillei DSM 43111]APC35887.1 IclR family transcriptional regulator [Nocardiopsis dassonvillei]NKY80129.1 helix-turn-helix domain-containing protein [Nocardiopsis dassonvillei]VEI88120.1 p-hydroxybenzoate hydroxylase transcriptional activator [Nocardiopsis dassonvillei]
MPTEEEEARGAHFVQSLERGLTVIRAFSAERRSMTLSEVARETDLTRAAARRFLLTLVDLGYVRTDGRLFSLTPRVLELGYAYVASAGLPDVAQPHLEDLSARVHESASVSVLEGDDVLYVARVATSRIMAVAIRVGTRFPASATSMGRVLLAGHDDRNLDAYLARVELAPLTRFTITDPAELRAELERVREQGYAIVDQELEEGLRSLAAPIRDGSGRVIAAANVSAHANRASIEDVRRDLLPALLETTARIEADLASVARRDAGS